MADQSTTYRQGQQRLSFVFCYGNRKEIILIKISLTLYEANIKEASQKTRKQVKFVFEEAKSSPKIFKQSMFYTPLKISKPASSSAHLFVKFVAGEDKIAGTQNSMFGKITEKIFENCGDKQQKSRKSLKQISETIINEIYASVSLEFTL